MQFRMLPVKCGTIKYNLKESIFLSAYIRIHKRILTIMIGNHLRTTLISGTGLWVTKKCPC